MPLPNNSLRYVLVYVFETDRGPYLDGRRVEHRRRLRRAAERHGGGRLRRSPTSRASWSPTSTRTTTGWPAASARRPGPGSRCTRPTPSSSTTATTSPTTCSSAWPRRLRRMGAPDEELEPLQNAAMPVRPLVDPVVPDVLLEDGARPEVPGWDLTAIWTPGHSPGHLCFYEAGSELMLSGDHVLPRITPNIPFHPQAGATRSATTWRRSTSSSPTRSTRCCRRTSTASTTCTRGSRSCASTTGTASPR